MPYRAHWKKLTIIVPVIVFAVFCLVQARADRLCEPGQVAEGEAETCVLMKLDMDGVWSDELRFLSSEVRSVLREAGVTRRSRVISDTSSAWLKIPDLMQQELAHLALEENFSADDFELARSADGATFTLTMTDTKRKEISDAVIERYLSVIPFRLDEPRRPNIKMARAGEYCISVHLPDYGRSRVSYHGSSPHLSFHYVEAEGALRDLKSSTKRPFMVVRDMRQDGRAWTVLKEPMFDDRLGRYKIDYARHKTDFWSAEAIVTFRFQDTSRKRFGNNDWFFEGKRYAVLLNGKVIAISPLKDLPLNGREGRIRGFSTVADAKKVAALMNLDGLPAKLIKVSDEKECAVT